ncbi:MAG: GAK system CofD-like protein [Thermodesulfobacteriota bacterium]|nr:GAK system CofD-like protein [Thermodesulfobacteriota bacterium]
MQITFTREVTIPDAVKLARYRKAPELGPRILFFSGGTALRDLSRCLIHYTHNSIHIITPFDSGGSSRRLRQVFHMPAIGDVRNRLMALADQTFQGHPEIFRLFAHRFPVDGDPQSLAAELASMATDRHWLINDIPDPMRKIIRHHLQRFEAEMPADFDLRGANIGNLVMTAGYLENRRHMDPVIYIFSKLVEVRGVVRPVINADLHLGAILENGECVLEQHCLTGKQTDPINTPIEKLYLVAGTRGKGSDKPVRVSIRDKMAKLIRGADLIVYPMGSFYSSVMANLLPDGVPEAIQKNQCPKVFVPSTGNDPECFGLPVEKQVRRLLACLTRNENNNVPTESVLNCVVVDTANGIYPTGLDTRAIAALGLNVIDWPLVTPESTPHLDPEALSEVILSLT